jgi:Skp family chaperone for outer membrane proteins
MNRKLPVLICFFSLFVAAMPSVAADLLDRIVATVNGHIILQSDWAAALGFAALTDGRTPDQISTQDRKAALDQLIDQELLREQMRSTQVKRATEDEVEKRIQEIRNQYGQTQDDQGWRTLLTHYGLTEKEVRQRVALELDLNRLVDVRLRPVVDVDPKTIESYYNQELLPQLRQTGAKEVPLAEATPKIKELLTEQKVNELLVAWLQDLRSGSEIQTEVSASDSRDEPR